MSTSHRPRLLVIDPDPCIRALLAAVTRRRGYDADTAGTFDEALQRVHSSSYELFIVEPRIAGGETLLEDLAGRRVVVATSVVDFVPRSKVAAVLRKPFLLDDFTAVIDAFAPETA